MNNKCSLCPHECMVNRNLNRGYCGATKKIKIAKACMHYCEEPCISGENQNLLSESKIKRGSGTIFFSNCNMKCVFCQNYKISQEGFGIEISDEKLASIMLNLQKNGAYNINLVTPTIYIDNIINALKIAKKNGLILPVIYNSGGYEKIDSIKKLDGLIDVYLPDLKYYNDDIAFKYSKINNYFMYASEAIKEMYRQVGSPVFDENGIIKKGIIIRHLILPNNIRDTKKLLNWILDSFGKDVYISIMAQYFPANDLTNYEKINRKITKKELKIVEQHMYNLGFTNGYIQKIGKNEEDYVPNFDLEGIM